MQQSGLAAYAKKAVAICWCDQSERSAIHEGLVMAAKDWIVPKTLGCIDEKSKSSSQSNRDFNSNFNLDDHEAQLGLRGPRGEAWKRTKACGDSELRTRSRASDRSERLTPWDRVAPAAPGRRLQERGCGSVAPRHPSGVPEKSCRNLLLRPIRAQRHSRGIGYYGERLDCFEDFWAH